MKVIDIKEQGIYFFCTMQNKKTWKMKAVNHCLKKYTENGIVKACPALRMKQGKRIINFK